MDFKNYGFNETMLEKRKHLLESGHNPYPYRFPGSDAIQNILEGVRKLEEGGANIDQVVTAAGRIVGKRSVFMDLKDQSGSIQLYFQKKEFKDTWDQIKSLDFGDIVGVSGELFRTHYDELTINVKTFTLLSKVVVPIPFGKEAGEKVFSRSTDPETRYRERYINWLLNQADVQRMRDRSMIISAVRQRMEADDFLEVSTPSIEFVYGGAEARPFKTNIWTLGNKDAFLRISPELYLKRFIVGGFNRVFTVCQNFRNEGIDGSHNPEFTMMEWYEAFTDYEDQMQRVESLVAGICADIHGSTRVTYQGVEIDFAIPWRRMTVLEALDEFAGINASGLSVEELRGTLNENGLEAQEPISWGSAVARLFEALCEEHLVQPVFIKDHPLEISPLTKVKRGDERLAERFEPYVCGMEIGNAYSELTDPVDQLDRLVAQRERQAAQRKKMKTKSEKKQEDDEIYDDHPLDADFIKAIGCGMPPTGGVGLGIDRIVMLLTDSSSIRDIIPFPMVKPKN